MATTAWKTPPVAKVYEALTAVADGRVTVDPNGRSAEVYSSDRKKSYQVTWSEDLQAFGSNDNASYWQGYAGYPIIATMMVLGRLQYSAPIAALLTGVAWKQINDLHKRDYKAAIESVLSGIDSHHRENVDAEVQRIWNELKSTMPRRLASRRPPGSK